MTTIGIGAVGSGSKQGGSIFAGSLGIRQMGMLDSTREKLERQQNASNEVAYWEEKKSALKERECENVEEIQRKLKEYHSYEDEIKAVKTAYNNEQMFHVLDEAEERAKKIAEAVEESKPKTEEERKKEAAEKAKESITGEEAAGGLLDDLMENAGELPEDLKQELEAAQKENPDQKMDQETLDQMDQMMEEAPPEQMDQMAEAVPLDQMMEETPPEQMDQMAEAPPLEQLDREHYLAPEHIGQQTDAEKLMMENARKKSMEKAAYYEKHYVPVDFRV